MTLDHVPLHIVFGVASIASVVVLVVLVRRRNRPRGQKLYIYALVPVVTVAGTILIALDPVWS